MIGGGMGIAPLYFLAQQLLPDTGAHHTILRSCLAPRPRPNCMLLAEEFTDLGYSVLTATDDGSLGHHGFVTELLDDILTRGQTGLCLRSHADDAHRCH